MGENVPEKIRENLSKKIKDVIKKTFQCIFQNYSMEIRKVHILARHFFNMKDNSAGIFFTEEDVGLDWLWCVIEEIVNLLIYDFKEFMKRGGQPFVGEQRRVVLEMPMTSLAGLSMSPERTEVTEVLIVYDCWKQSVITAHPCVAPLRFLQPDEDDGWISS
jgi:hypothetical protein